MDVQTVQLRRKCHRLLPGQWATIATHDVSRWKQGTSWSLLPEIHARPRTQMTVDRKTRALSELAGKETSSYASPSPARHRSFRIDATFAGACVTISLRTSFASFSNTCRINRAPGQGPSLKARKSETTAVAITPIGIRKRFRRTKPIAMKSESRVSLTSRDSRDAP